MTGMNKGLLVAAAFVALAACSSPQAPSVQSPASEATPITVPNGEGAAHDVAWYKTHDSERKAMQAKCNNDPGSLQNNPDCVNAERAAEDLTWSSNKGIPAMKAPTFDRNKDPWADMKAKPQAK